MALRHRPNFAPGTGYSYSLTFDRDPFTAQLKAADQLIFDQLCGQR